MKFENAIIYNGKFYRVGEEVPVEKIEKVTDESTNTEKAKRRVKPKTEVV